MILKNYYRYFGMCLGGDKSTPYQLTNTRGSSINAYHTTASVPTAITHLNDLHAYISGNKTQGVLFGDGTTPPSINDYWLSGNAVSGLTMTSVRSATSEEDSSTLTMLYTITNGNDHDVTIGEIGYSVSLSYFTSPTVSSASSDYFLIERTVLDTPITIPAGGVGQITYNIRMNYPAA